MPLNDLNQMFSIVDPATGKPTDYLMRLLRDRGVQSENIEETVAALQILVNNINGTVFSAGTGLSGGGTLGTDDPISFLLDAVLGNLSDVDTTTTPPTDGQALLWVDADSLWKPGTVSGGGGGSGWTEQTLTNFNFATGDLSGWTTFAGSFTNVADSDNPMGGGRRIDAGANSTNAIYQDIDVSSFATDIDNGNFEARTVLAWRSGFSDDDHAQPLIFCLDGSNNELARIAGGYPPFNTSGGQRFIQEAQGIVPINTRTLRVFAMCRRVAGTNCDADIYGVRVFTRT